MASYSIDFNSSSTDKIFYHAGDGLSNPFNFTPEYLTLDIIKDTTCTNTNRGSLTLIYERSSTGSLSFLTPIYDRGCGGSYSYYIKPLSDYSDLLYLAFNNNSTFFSGFTYRITLYDSYPFNSFVPSGSLSISENGTYDVTNYAEAVVDVPQTFSNPYHDDLQDIKSAILIGCACLLVIYFFYCIYRMIIKGSGVSS